jgi:hypothetical protein
MVGRPAKHGVRSVLREYFLKIDIMATNADRPVIPLPGRHLQSVALEDWMN